ncbi:DUF4040 domain-containing protein [Natrinema salifodinae]|uniref:Multisubunit sodium/proton antiporter, MrpB subunit n=1 Tax=Natrinema salifodinae TaxID=1202768 RepID=A0A1I0M3Z1_9EURY|nr:DUF4040 domain-containing protein [Natrinema salifodinae]SEV82674.1 multisubunit sodium/proton antiporter, MrpB subunit [Natrinema salifodinae]
MNAFVFSLAVFVLASAVATALFRDVLSSIIVFGAYSLGMAILYTFLLAPDVAMTEAAIGAGVTTLLLLLTIARTTRPATDGLLERIHLPAVAVVGAFVLVLCVAVLPEMYAIGGTETPVWSNPDVTQHYIQETYEQTGVQNAVTSVLAAYRGFDTFGEAVVVFAAGVSTLLVLKREVFA